MVSALFYLGAGRYGIYPRPTLIALYARRVIQQGF